MNHLLDISVEETKENLTLKESKKNNHKITICLATMIVLALISFWLFCDGIKAGAEALTVHYENAYSGEKDKAYQIMYNNAFEKAEKKYHVSNRGVISIKNLEEISRLEIIKANDVEFITENRNENSGKITAWLEVTGEGTFVIDLQAAEFIIDDEHQYVLVRVPHPTLTDVSITDTQKRFFEDDWKNGSYREGVELAQKQRNEASMRIQKSLMANQYVYLNAKSVAESMIQNLVKQFNPDIPELKVEVEFMD